MGWDKMTPSPTTLLLLILGKGALIIISAVVGISFKDTTSSLQNTLSKNQTKLHLLSTVFQPFFPTHEQELRQLFNEVCVLDQ